jgi:hypothetical protein
MPQYMSFYKDHWELLVTLPICAHFDKNSYKAKKPMPSNNTCIAIEGFIIHFDIDSSTGLPSIFHLTVDNNQFSQAGAACHPTSQQKCALSSTASFSLMFCAK